MNTSDVIFDILKQYTDVVFFVPGGQAAFLVDALGRSGLKHISALHEQGAGFMACGYAQYTGRLGVCLVTSGPGATNAITPCAAAWMDSLPVLFISGQANLHPNDNLRVRGVQSVNIVYCVDQITKRVYLIDRKVLSPNMVFVKGMIETCLSDRPGPCWIDIPLNMQAEEI